MAKIFEKKVNISSLLLLLLAASPGFWWALFQPGKVFSEWQKSPLYFQAKISSLFSEERLLRLGSLRWANIDEATSEIFISRFFYNKLTVFVDEFFSFTSFLSPRFYFQAGDGSGFSPPGIEPIPIFLFPLWVYGLLKLVKGRRFRAIYLLLLFGFGAFLFGQRTLAYLWPVLLVNIYIAKEGLVAVSKSRTKAFLILGIFIYSLYIGGRALWLSN